MKKQINLIPAGMSVPLQAVKITKVVNKISLTLAAILSVVVILSISLFIYFKIEFNKINLSIEVLKTQIISLESNEQKLVIAKDRLDKIKAIQTSNTFQKDLANYKTITDLLNGVSDTSLIEATIQRNNTALSLSSKTTESLASVLGPISKLKGFKNMILTSLNYGSISGYLSEILATK